MSDIEGKRKVKGEAAYRLARDAWRDRCLREEPSRTVRCSELELQARIFRGEFGAQWIGVDGEQIEVRHFGEWNREPGPDFRGATVRIDGRETTGDIEIDSAARDWDDHGHANNPDFNGVVLHLFLHSGSRRRFSRTTENKSVVQVCLPTTPRSPRPGMIGEGPFLDETRIRLLIDAAAAFRLRRKSEALQRAKCLCGWDGALFQALATGLGYKNNKIPFLLVAQRVGWQRVQSEDGEALLFGLAGFLQASHFDDGDETNRAYLAPLWERWWPRRDQEARLTLNHGDWKWAAIRPANHPHRRMGALARVVTAWDAIRSAVEAGSVERFSDALRRLSHPFWDLHASLAKDPLPRKTALIGEDRTKDLVINVLFPAMEFSEASVQSEALRGPAPGRRMVRTLEWLGGVFTPSLCRSARDQQGLLQIHEDFFGHSPESIWETLVSHGQTEFLHSRRDDGESI